MATGNARSSRLAAARDAICARRLLQPKVGIVLGSGLGCLADRLQHATRIPYAAIPYFACTRAVGHAGHLWLGYLAGVPAIVMQGRAHRYEGLANWQAGFPIECMQALGAEALITTNAAGGLNGRFRTGDLMVIDGHLDFLWSRGLWDPAANGADWPPARIPPYDLEWIHRAQTSALARHIVLHRGCYLATLGPCYETRSEYRMFRMFGADAVGMSTIPEVLAAQRLGLKTVAFSVISNVASTDVPQSTTHDDVIVACDAAGPRLMQIIEDLLEDMAGHPD